MIFGELRALLISDSGVAALAASRIHANRLPQNTAYPCAVLTLISTRGEHSHDGASNLNDDRWQMDCYAATVDEAVALARAIDARLDGYKGEAGSPPIDINGIFRIGGMSDPEDGLDRAGPSTERVMLEFNIWWKRIDT